MTEGDYDYNHDEDITRRRAGLRCASGGVNYAVKNRAGKIWCLPLLAAALAGCVTPSRIDWAARVGSYTYDQAVTDLGPPDKAAKLSDGSTVDEWLERPGQIIVTPRPYFAAPGYFDGAFAPAFSETRFPPAYLRLTFAPDGRLKQFKQYAR